MDIATALIFTVGSIVGAIIVTQLWQMNWFKKENFKLQRDFAKKKGMIDLKKMELDLGIKPAKKTAAAINPDMIKGLIDQYLNPEEETEENPISNILKGFLSTEQGQKMAQEVLKGALGENKTDIFEQ